MELVTYTNAYTEVHDVTGDILDIVIPYERMVIRTASVARTRTVEVPNPDFDPEEAERAKKCDPTLFASGTCPKPPSETLKRKRTVSVPIEKTCLKGYRGPDPFCYEIRDAYATIGDPPLVGAYRSLSNIVQRFNAVLIAYAEGASFKFVQQDLNGLSTAIDTIGRNPYFKGGGVAAQQALSRLVGQLLPIAQTALNLRDRDALRVFLIENYEMVDEALEQMARNSPTLYSNVGVGTQLFRLRRIGDGAALNKRRKAIRKIIANWTVVLEDTQRLLATLKTAIENPDSLESRLRNLTEPSVKTSSNIDVIKKQISTLGGPPELP